MGLDFDEITAWDRFAAATIQGLLASGKVSHEALEHVAAEAAKMATQMVHARRRVVDELCRNDDPDLIQLPRDGSPGPDRDGSGGAA